MPILKGAATFRRFKVEATDAAGAKWKKTLPHGLRTKRFEPLDRSEPVDRRAGFCELEDHDATEFSVGSLFFAEHAAFAWRIDEYRIPASALKQELDRWVKEFTRENERPPGRREKQDAKAEIRHTMRARAPIVTRTFDVSWAVDKDELLLWAGANKVVDEVQEVLEQSFKLKLIPQIAPTIAASLGIADAALAPTPALSLGDAKREVPHARA